MNTPVCDVHFRAGGRKAPERFRLRFQRALQRYASMHGSVARAFGLVLERTLQEVPVDDDTQVRLYWELIRWAKSCELFTAPVERSVLNYGGTPL